MGLAVFDLVYTSYSNFKFNLDEYPRECWNTLVHNGKTLLHCACQVGDAHAVRRLLASGVNVNASPCGIGRRPIHFAMYGGSHAVIELLCAAGADITTGSACDLPPLLEAVHSNREWHEEAAKVLIANGARLATCYASQELIDFERGVLRCRAAAVAVLRVKRAGQLWRWDKFLLREMAIAIWTARYENWEAK